MIIWRGAGILVPFVAFACLVLVELSVERAFSDDHYYQRNGWPVLVALTTAAAIVWLIGARLNRRTAPGNTHTLFFIPMQYWAPILAAGGIVFALAFPFMND